MFTYLHTMPDKKYVKGCGKECIRCWVNRQKHGNKLKKKFFPKKFEMNKSWMSEEKEYFSFFEEFIDKFCVRNSTPELIADIDSGKIDVFEENNKLIKQTTQAYLDWVLKEKGVKERLKEKDLIETMNHTYRNSDTIESLGFVSQYPMYGEKTYTPDSKPFYLFKCTYKNT